MPSDLTISKLKDTTTPTVSTREQEIAASHRKAASLKDLEEALAPYKEEQENRQKAIAAGFLGAPADIVQIAANTFADALVAKRPEVPYTTDDLRERWGVEGAEWSTLLGAVASPDPIGDVGAIGKALILPMGYVRKAGKKADELYQAAVKMFANGEDPVQIYRATGAFKLKGDEILWHKRDTGYIDPEDVRRLIDNDPEIAQQGLDAGEETFINARPRDLLKGDDEIFDMFPFLDNVKVRFHVKNYGTLEKPRYKYRNDAMAEIGARGQADIVKGEVDLFNAGSEYRNWQESAASTMYHELGHIIDAVGGVIPTGGNTQYVANRYKNLQLSKAARDLFDDIKGGNYIEDWMNASQDDAMHLTNIFEKYGVDNPQDVSFLKEHYVRYADAMDAGDFETANLLESIADGGINRNTAALGAVLQEMGEDFPIENIDLNTAIQLGSDRYYKLEGEARQRLNQYMYNKRDEEIRGFFENVARGKSPEGMQQPVDPADMILEEPKKVDPSKFTGADGSS